MKRRDLIGALAGSVVLPAAASTKLKGSEKMKPVDTVNAESDWVNGPVGVLDIKGVRIGEGRPKIIASTTANTPESFIRMIGDCNSRSDIDMIELRADYVGEISGKEFAKLTLEACKIAPKKPLLLTFRDKTEGGARHVSD